MPYINELGQYILGDYLVGVEAASTSFDLQIQTTTPNETFTLPCQNVGTFNAVVDWGDGNEDVITAYNQTELTHTYATVGTHSISVSGTFPNIFFKGDATSAAKVIRVTNLGIVGWTRFIGAFRGCSNMVEFSCGNTDTSQVTVFSEMFFGCASAAVLDVSRFDTSACTGMAFMFSSCSSAENINVSGFNTSLCSQFRFMFDQTSSLSSLDVSGFDTSLCADFSFMFRSCAANDIDVSGFDVSLVTSAPSMFSSSSMSTDNYDATLIAWAAQSHQNNVTAHFGNSTYTAGGAAEAARDALIADGWTITDGGFTGIDYLQFNGSDQYAEHAPFTPTGVNFTLSARYTPAAADIGSLVTLWGDGVLQKDSANNLVFNYTDTAATSQSTTLSALSLVADTEYLITVSSDGNGVSVTVGADTALNSAVIDPSTLEIESWMASAGATLSAGIIRDIDFQDDSAIQDGTFLEGDSSTVYVALPDITLSGAYTVEATVDYTQGNTFYLYGNSGGFTDRTIIDGTSDTLNFRSPGAGAESLSSAAGEIKNGHQRIISTRDASGDASVSVNGASIASGNVGVNAVTINQLMRNGTVTRGSTLQIKITDDTNGDTWEYLLNNITSEGIAPNTGNTEGSNIWASPTILGDDWTDNGDGSYTLITTGDTDTLRIDTAIAGGAYNISFDLSYTNQVSGWLLLRSNAGSQVVGTFPTGGTKSFRATLLGSDVRFLRDYGGADFECTISNIVIERTFSGIVNNYDPVTDLVTIPNNTRRYLDPAIDSNIQADENNADGPELFVPTLLQAGWTDNGDGSYSWDTSAVTYIDAGFVLEVGKFYHIKASTTGVSDPAVQTGFSGSGFGAYDLRFVNIGNEDIGAVMEATGTHLRFFVNQTPSTGTVSNISVKETTSAEIINFDQSMVQS